MGEKPPESTLADPQKLLRFGTDPQKLLRFGTSRSAKAATFPVTIRKSCYVLDRDPQKLLRFGSWIFSGTTIMIAWIHAIEAIVAKSDFAREDL